MCQLVLAHSLVSGSLIVHVLTEVNSFTCSIVHVLTGVNSFSCLERYVTPLRFACLPRGDPGAIYMALVSIENHIFCRVVLWELLSLGFQGSKSIA